MQASSCHPRPKRKYVLHFEDSSKPKEVIADYISESNPAQPGVFQLALGHKLVGVFRYVSHVEAFDLPLDVLDLSLTISDLRAENEKLRAENLELRSSRDYHKKMDLAAAYAPRFEPPPGHVQFLRAEVESIFDAAVSARFGSRSRVLRRIAAMLRPHLRQR